MKAVLSLRLFFAGACIVLLAGCLPQRVGAVADDPDKALLYLHVAAADLALLAGSALESGDGGELLAADVQAMQAAAKQVPASDPRAKKLASLVDEAARTAAELEKALPEVAAAQAASRSLSARTPQLEARWGEVIRGMGESGASLAQLQIANRQVVLLDRMPRRASEIEAGGDRAITAADALSRDMEVCAQVLEGMRAGNRDLGLERVASPLAQSALAAVAGLQAEQAVDAQRLVALQQAVNAAHQAAQRLLQVRLELLEAAPAKFTPPAR